MKKPNVGLRTWVEINKKAIAHNYRVFRKLIGKKTKFLAVVKSNAYGHNIAEFAPEMEKLGADWIGVDSLVEGLTARKAGVTLPILVLGYTLPSLYEEARRKGVSVTISNFHQLDEALKLPKGNKPLKIHIKVDTGMHRQGFQLEESNKLLATLSCQGVALPFFVEGLYTHFAEAKNPRSGDNTRKQIERFKQWIDAFHKAGMFPICHAAATGGTLLYPEGHFDMVRVGIGCYGLWPSPEAQRELSKKIELKPVLSWKALVSEVKHVKSGERVGYDFTELLMRDTTLAVIPVGYWHGLPRLNSSRGRVLIHGKTARIIGRVSMDMIVVDVTDIPKVKVGNEATLIGKEKNETITASEIARLADTTHYEIVTRLNPLMQKIYK